MTPATESKLAALRQLVRSVPSALVAYSGGVDSAVVMAVAHQELGDRALACIGSSPSLPQRELREAVKMARDFGAHVRVIDTHEADDPNYAANPTNRCYFCKSELHTQLTNLLAAENWHVIFDGNNASDVGEYRPGVDAAREKGVRSPLQEAGITKPEVREIAHHLGLAAWDKPAMACLSSRIPHGTPVTPELLKQIETCEDTLADLGFKQFRVRHHGDTARIELEPEDLIRAVEHRETIVRSFRAAGYRFVSLDLAGYQRGAVGAEMVTLNVRPTKT